jgi:tricorn protease-like protein
MDRTQQFLKDLVEAHGPSGYEHGVGDVMQRYLKGVGTFSRDRLGSFICEKKGSGKPKVMLAGHLDEVGFVVKSITKEGFIKFIPLGGWWGHVVLAQRLRIRTRKGDVIGVVGSKPPHELREEDRKRAPRRFTRVFYKLDSVGWVGDRRKHLFVIDIDGGDERQLTEGDCENDQPAWSPDGKQIVFRRMLGEMNSEVFVANGDGSEPRNLSNHAAFDGWPAWSPDGKRIAFGSNRNANYQIFLMNADGTEVRLLANTEGRATEPRWSPDGRTVYFTICRKVDFGADCQVFAASVEPRTPTRP